MPRADRTRGGRPPFDHVLMFKVLILQAMHSLSDERAEFLIKDRLSFIRFLGLGLSDNVPDPNTIWTFREALKKAGSVDDLFSRFDEALRREGFLAMSGQIVDATIVPAPEQRNTIAEKDALRDGASPANGRTSLPRSRRRIGTPAGRSNTPRRSPARTAASRRSISPFPPSATRTTARSTGRSGSYAIGLRRMRRPMTGPGLKRSSTGRTPPATHGGTRPTGRRRTKRC